MESRRATGGTSEYQEVNLLFAASQVGATGLKQRCGEFVFALDYRDHCFFDPESQ